VNARAEALIRAQTMPLAGAARCLAAAGVAVFPCARGGKAPLVRHGLLDATTDPARVERWWGRWPGANIGMPTGPVSGFDVVDVDARGSGSGHERFREAAARLGALAWALRVATPSGGEHFYYPAEPGQPQRNWASATALVDFRGAGGYVIVPPSVGADRLGRRRPYRLVEARAASESIDSRALRDMLEPGRAARRASTRRGPVGTGGPAGLREWVAALREGERNQGLFWAACRMAEAGHGLDAALGALGPAAERCGLPEREVMATVRSAYRHALPAAAATGWPEAPRTSTPDRTEAVVGL
jgi:hypothetical protein